MKKILALVLCLLILASLSVPAFADSGLTVTEKVLIECEGSSSAYFFAKIENTGESPVGVGRGKLVGFSGNDDVLITEDYISTYPSDLVLAPGEHAYLYESIWENALETDDIADYKFSITESDYPEKAFTLPCEAKFESASSYENYVFVTFTNNTEEVLFGAYISVAMFDKEGNLICVDGNHDYYWGVHPGSTVTVAVSVDSDLMDYYAKNGIEIGTVEAIVYQMEE